MSTPELFEQSEIACDSPKLKWMRKHGIKTQRCDFNSRMPAPFWEAWAGERDEALMHGGYNPCAGGIAEGETEEDAIVSLAIAMGIRLWNEEEKP